MEKEQRQQIETWLTMLVAHKVFILTSVLLSLYVGLAIYLTTPKKFQATALLRYQQQSVTPNRLSPDVRLQIRQMIATVGQEVTSRSSLEKIIRQHDLYKEQQQQLPMEDVVNTMRSHHITIKQPERQGDIFTVSFAGREPQLVKQVTNSLAARFIEENIRFRAEQVAKTKAYVGEELQIAKKALDQKEATMRDYKLKFYNEMPGQQQANISNLSRRALWFDA